MHEIKKLNTSITTIRSEMSKYDEQLDDCRRYRAFLDRLTPPEWVAQQREAKAERRRARRAAERARLERLALEEAAAKQAAAEEDEARAAEAERPRAGRKPRGRAAEEAEAAAAQAAEERRSRIVPRPIRDEEVLVDDSGDELPMFFAEPAQLLEIFASLEESNLFLIQNSQETEEALEVGARRAGAGPERVRARERERLEGQDGRGGLEMSGHRQAQAGTRAHARTQPPPRALRTPSAKPSSPRPTPPRVSHPPSASRRRAGAASQVNADQAAQGERDALAPRADRCAPPRDPRRGGQGARAARARGQDERRDRAGGHARRAQPARRRGAPPRARVGPARSVRV